MSSMEESLLNFCYITGAFYQYVQISGENFDLMKKNNINEIKIGQNNAIIEKEFESKNNNNYMDYYNKVIKEKLINSKKALSKEIIELKKLIDEKNKQINKYKIMEEKLLEIDKNQDKEISKLKDSIKMILKNLNDQKIEFKEEVKLLKKELKAQKIESEEEVKLLKKELNESKSSISQLENKLKDSEETITFMKEKLNYSEKNSEKKITLLNIELGIANGKQLELVNDIKKLKDCIIKLNEKIDKKEEEYNFMKNLNLQIIIDYVSSKNANPQNHQSAITNNGLLRCLNLISKDYELIKSKLDEKNEQLENIKKMFKKNK